MSDKTNRIRPGVRTPHWEKKGNTVWVSCADCQGWFPVGPELLEMATVKLMCPHCHAQFLPEAAAKVIEP